MLTFENKVKEIDLTQDQRIQEITDKQRVDTTSILNTFLKEQEQKLINPSFAELGENLVLQKYLINFKKLLMIQISIL